MAGPGFGVAALVLLSLSAQARAESCVPPELENGWSHGEGDESYWIGKYNCQAGFALVGAVRAKCRDGIWSSRPPVCTALGMCDKDQLPVVKFARVREQKNFRESVYKYSCRKGYQRFGQGRVFCDGSNWNLYSPPVCAKTGCEEGLMTSLKYGKAKTIGNGAMIRYKCDADTVMSGPKAVFCDGHSWNDSMPICQKAASVPEMSVRIGEELLEATSKGQYRVQEGDLLTVQCEAHEGNPEPVLALFIDEEQAMLPAEYRISFSFEATREHQNIQIRCTAKNNFMEEAVETAAQLIVQYAATSIEISGPAAGMVGDAVSFRCAMGYSYPQAAIQWIFEQDVETIKADKEINELTALGYKTYSEVTVRLPEEHHFVTGSCRGVSRLEGAQDLFNSTTVEVHRIASEPHVSVQPSVSGVHQIVAGQTIFTIQCNRNGGNPAPVLSLYLNGVELVEPQYEDISFSQEATAEHANAVIECHAVNSVMQAPAISTLALQVYIPVTTTTTTTTTTAPETTINSASYDDDYYNHETADQTEAEAATAVEIEINSLSIEDTAEAEEAIKYEMVEDDRESTTAAIHTDYPTMEDDIEEATTSRIIEDDTTLTPHGADTEYIYDYDYEEEDNVHEIDDSVLEDEKYIEGQVDDLAHDYEHGEDEVHTETSEILDLLALEDLVNDDNYTQYHHEEYEKNNNDIDFDLEGDNADSTSEETESGMNEARPAYETPERPELTPDSQHQALGSEQHKAEVSTKSKTYKAELYQSASASSLVVQVQLLVVLAAFLVNH